MKSQAWLKILGRVATVALLVFMASCSGIQKKKRLPGCNAVFDLIRNRWQQDAKTGLYSFKTEGIPDPELRILDSQDCLHALSTRDVKELFGTPNSMSQGSMVYYLSLPCLKTEATGATGCHYMLVKLNPDATVKDIWFLTNTSEH